MYMCTCLGGLLCRCVYYVFRVCCGYIALCSQCSLSLPPLYIAGGEGGTGGSGEKGVTEEREYSERQGVHLIPELTFIFHSCVYCIYCCPN